MLSASQLQSLAHGLFPPDEGTDCLVETERVFFLEKVGKAKFFVDVTPMCWHPGLLQVEHAMCIIG